MREARAALLAELVRELRQFNGLSASYFRAAAARSGMNATDLQVIDLLDSAGLMSAGQLAELTGLTTGAISGMLNRLEEAGVVRRERDPEDGRRVIVRLVPENEDALPISGFMGSALDELAARYDDERLALLVEFFQRSNAISRQEILRLRETPEGAKGWRPRPLAPWSVAVSSSPRR
jgi:DNA-binding MarR family transcriptional regulator